MALKKPIVLYSGQLAQLQAGDVLSVPGVAGGDVVSQTNDEVGSIVICTVVYNDAADGVKKAKADASGTAKAIGLVLDATIASAAAGFIQVNGVMSATTGQWDTAFGTTGGLTFGTAYYLSPTTAGLGTATAPTTVGQYVQRLGIAISTTEFLVDIQPPILL